MTSASPAPMIPFPASVELFYSYARADGLLCEELRKHLTALKRSGLIRDWYDRKIEEGSEWALQIQEAMERAGIILLLISADFLASSYINDKELPFALKRHTEGAAVVIPVLLRPVEWRDTPFAKLAVLPSDAKPVTAWPDRDAAFSDVAGRLRELLYRRRLDEVSPPAKDPVRIASAERVLDAAIASQVVIDEPTDLVLMVRTQESGGLQAILRIDRNYSPQPEDVHSKTFAVDFPRDPMGQLLPAVLRLALESPGCEPPSQTRKIRIPPTGDSDIVVFMLTPKRAGLLRLTLQLMFDEVEIGSQRLVTNALSSVGESLSYGVVTMPLRPPPAPTGATGVERFVTTLPAPYAPRPESPGRPAFGTDLILGKPIQSESRPNKLRPWMLVSGSIAAALLCVIFLPTLQHEKGTATFGSKGEPPVVFPAELDADRMVRAYTEYRAASRSSEILPTPDKIRQQLTEADRLEKAGHKDQARLAWQKMLNATPKDAANPVRRLAEQHLATLR